MLLLLAKSPVSCVLCLVTLLRLFLRSPQVFKATYASSAPGIWVRNIGDYTQESLRGPPMPTALGGTSPNRVLIFLRLTPMLIGSFLSKSNLAVEGEVARLQAKINLSKLTSDICLRAAWMRESGIVLMKRFLT